MQRRNNNPRILIRYRILDRLGGLILIQRLWAWLTGYLVLKFKGPGVEILFNRILDADWDLWDIERLSVDTLIAKISIKGFRKIRPLVRDLPVRINIVGKYGFPFYLNKAQTRYFYLSDLLFSQSYCITYQDSFGLFRLLGLSK